MKDFDKETLSTAKAILDYLKQNPDAKDNIDGISKWWIHEDKEVVIKALDYLVREKRILSYDSKKKLFSLF